MIDPSYPREAMNKIAGGTDIHTLLTTANDPLVNMTRNVLLLETLSEKSDEQIADLLMVIGKDYRGSDPKLLLIHHAIARLYRSQGDSMSLTSTEPDA